jgi:hypothetical protein
MPEAGHGVDVHQSMTFGGNMKTLKLMTPLALVILLIPLQALGFGEEETFRDMGGRLLSTAAYPGRRVDEYRELSVGVRVPFLAGDIDNFGEKWTDYFESVGVGLEISGARLWSVSDKVAIGVYLSLDVDMFSGKTIDVGGIQEAFDDLTMVRFMVGCRVRETFGKFFMDQNIGIGLVSYSPVNADALGTSVGVIDGSTVFAFEIGYRFGIVISPVVDLGMSLSYNYNAAPDPSSDLTAVIPDLKYSAQSNFVLGFFVNINF